MFQSGAMDLAAPLPAAVIAHLIGLDPSEAEDLRRYSAAFLATVDSLTYGDVTDFSNFGGAVIDATERLADFTDTQRRLIAARDRHCVFPGCDAPPSWCDVHHLHWKTNGGGRSLDNGALLCRRHHTLIHRVHTNNRRWTLHRAPNGTGWHATSPTGTTWTGHPHRAATGEQPGSPSPPGREPPDHRARPAA